MRVALLTPVFRPAVGGMERFAEDLADWLTQEGHDVTVVTQTPAGPPDPTDTYPVVRTATWADAAQVIDRADVVHINGLSVRASLAAARVGKRPVVTHAAHQAICPTGIARGPGGTCSASGTSPGPCANCFRHGPSPWLNVRVQRLAARRAAVNVCISQYLQRRLGVARSTTIYNPVSAEAFEQAASERHGDLIVFVGRLAQEKGPALLLHALARLPEVRLALVGDGPQRGELEALAVDLGVRSRVELRGSLARREVLASLREATLACVPTTCEEAFGYSAAEAMATGTPVVATPSGALPELLDDARGYLAHTITPEGVADAIRLAMSDEQETARRAARAEAFARSALHIDVTGPAYVSAYEHAQR